MSNSILGETGQPELFSMEYEVEVGDDEYLYLDGELVEEENIWGYRGICPKNSQTTTVTIKFYYYAPTSEWFWGYVYGTPYAPLIPLVYTCDSNWNLVSCLNQSYYEFALDGHSSGWLSLNVTLQRKLIQNERIFFGVYSDLLGVAAIDEADPNTTMSYIYFSSERRRNYSSQIAYVTSAAFFNKIRCLNDDFQACIYLEYENEIESVAYTRTVLGNVHPATANVRKLNWKRTLRPGGYITSSLNRKTVWKRRGASNGLLSAGAFRFNHLFRSASDSKSFTDANDKRIFFFRSYEDQESFTARSYRSNRIKIENSDGFSFADSIQHFLLILRSVFSDGGGTDSLLHQSDYKRLSESIVNDEEIIIRSGDNFRSFTDEVDFEALPFASRLFFRTVQTVMSFWDWLRGKIREANNVVTLFCPIADEITLECKI